MECYLKFMLFNEKIPKISLALKNNIGMGKLKCISYKSLAGRLCALLFMGMP